MLLQSYTYRCFFFLWIVVWSVFCIWLASMCILLSFMREYSLIKHNIASRTRWWAAVFFCRLLVYIYWSLRVLSITIARAAITTVMSTIFLISKCSFVHIYIYIYIFECQIKWYTSYIYIYIYMFRNPFFLFGLQLYIFSKYISTVREFNLCLTY